MREKAQGEMKRFLLLLLLPVVCVPYKHTHFLFYFVDLNFISSLLMLRFFFVLFSLMIFFFFHFIWVFFFSVPYTAYSAHLDFDNILQEKKHKTVAAKIFKCNSNGYTIITLCMQLLDGKSGKTKHLTGMLFCVLSFRAKGRR